MKTTLVALLGVLILVAPCMAKDKEYYAGTLNKVPLRVEKEQYLGFTDTTSCSSGLASTHCTGGVTDDYKGKLIATMPDGHLVVIRDCYTGSAFVSCSQPWVFVLTEEDGTTTFLEHVQFGSGEDKFGDKFGDNAKVLYRIEHKPGVTFILIPDPANPKREGSYTRMKLPKQPAEQDVPAQASENISAMCTSGKLSPEQQAKFCAPTPTTDKKP